MAVEIYVSTDVETDGPIPGPNSMLSFASAAFLEDKTMVGTFSANLELLPGATGDPKTMKWWSENKEAWEASRKETRDPGDAMNDYLRWLKSLPGRPVFVAYPAGFDFMFVYWYLIRFAGESPFSFSALDVKSFAMAMLGFGRALIWSVSVWSQTRSISTRSISGRKCFKSLSSCCVRSLWAEETVLALNAST